MGELKDYNFWLNFFIGRIKNLSSYKQHLFNFIKTTVRYVIKTASGSIASFSDGVDMPIISLKAHIEPVQDLHGYENPWPAGGGSNRWDEEWEVGIYNATTGQPESSSGNIRGKNPISVAASTAYYASISGGGTIRILYYDSADTFISSEMKQNAAFTTPSNAAFVRISTINYGLTYNNNIAINYPSTVTTYSPYSNECPITGHTGATVERTGANIWDEEWESGQYNGNPNTGVITKAVDNTRIRSKNDIPVKENTTYYVFAPQPLFAYFLDKDKNWMNRVGSNGTTLAKNASFTTPEGCAYIKFFTVNTAAYDKNISINYPSTDHEYHAYQGETIPVSWESEAGTVYGGELDVVSGKLTVDMAIVDLGALTWTRGSTNVSGEYRFMANPPIPTVPAQSGNSVPNMVCSHYRTVSPNATYTQTQGVSNNLTLSQITLFDPVYKSGDVTAFKTAMSGVQLCYELAEPIEYTLTPQEVRTFLGQNNLWSDTGNTEVTYLSKEE